MLYYHLGLFIPRSLAMSTARGLGKGYAFGDDFYPIWLSAQPPHRDLYRQETTRDIQTGLFGRPLDPGNPADPPADYRQFAYPAFTDLLLWPAALVDFRTLRVILAVALPSITALSVWFWLRALGWQLRPLWFAILLLLSLCNYPVLEAIFVAQAGLLVGFLLAGAAFALSQNRLTLAGTLLSLTLIKPQMTALAIAYLLIWSLAERSRARLWVRFSLTTALLVGASLIVWPHWIEQWVRVLLGYHRYATPPLVSLLPGAALGKFLGPALTVALIVAGLALAWRNRRASVDSSDFWRTFSLLLAIASVAILPGQAVYDHIILLPGILLLLRYRREIWNSGRVPRVLLALGGVALIWQWAAAFAVTLLHSLGTDSFLALPLRTAASLPFAALALLACMMQVSVASPRVAA